MALMHCHKLSNLLVSWDEKKTLTEIGLTCAPEERPIQQLDAAITGRADLIPPRHEMAPRLLSISIASVVRLKIRRKKGNSREKSWRI